MSRYKKNDYMFWLKEHWLCVIKREESEEKKILINKHFYETLSLPFI